MVPSSGTIRSMIMWVLKFLKWLYVILKKKSSNKPVVKVLRSQAFTKKAIKPDNTPLYLKRGWTAKRNRYRGYYRTAYGAWRGEIIRRGDKFNVFIFNPPIEKVKNHPRWPCFHKDKSGRWRIDLAKNPKDRDLSAIIFYVERVIIESFNK
jgi:hypothetical protein